MTYMGFLSELDVLVDAGKLGEARELLDAWPEYRKRYESELDTLQEQADCDETLRGIDPGKLYDRLKKKLE